MNLLEKQTRLLQFCQTKYDIFAFVFFLILTEAVEKFHSVTFNILSFLSFEELFIVIISFCVFPTSNVFYSFCTL